VHFAHDYFTKAWVSDAREAIVARAADVICSPSRALVSYPETHWGVSASKTVHLPNMYQPSQSFLDLPPAENQGCIGYFGRLEVGKGLLTLARSLPAIAREFPRTKVLFVGQNRPLPGIHADAQEYMAGICRALGLEAEFPGRQPHDRLHEWYGRCQIVMLPSVWDNFPYVCLEAMAAGRAVIGSTRGGMADMITPDETGLLADPTNPAEFAAHALRLLRDPGLCTRLGGAARRSVVERYSAAALLPRYEDVYRQAIAHRLRSGPRPIPWLS
jgi:glycosyltransferase involved in cell wall biosynthesis